jgi:hypothetical protein
MRSTDTSDMPPPPTPWLRRVVRSLVVVAMLLSVTLGSAPAFSAARAPAAAHHLTSRHAKHRHAKRHHHRHHRHHRHHAAAASSHASPSGPTEQGGAVRPGTGTTTLQAGLTQTQHTADPWRNPTAVGSARQILANGPYFQDQAIMGWGVGNPEPSPGVYDWSGLSERISLIEDTGGTPVITLCGAPDWMKGGTAGTTNWNNLDEAPLPAYYEDFAQLAVAVAEHFPQVHSFMVWNELKGFWDSSTNNWDIADYTTLYNDVYTALKAYNPSLQVGGPYLVLQSWADQAKMSNSSDIGGAWGWLDGRDVSAIEYWHAHAVGADFVAVDAGTATVDDGTPTRDQDFLDTQKFADLTTWLRQVTGLPVWWAEYYPNSSSSDPERLASLDAAALAGMASAGASHAFLWGPECDPSWTATPCLWTPTDSYTGGQATPTATVEQWFADDYAGGSVTWSGSAITVDGSGSDLVVDTSAGTFSVVPGADTS